MKRFVFEVEVTVNDDGTSTFAIQDMTVPASEMNGVLQAYIHLLDRLDPACAKALGRQGKR